MLSLIALNAAACETAWSKANLRKAVVMKIMLGTLIGIYCNVRAVMLFFARTISTNSEDYDHYYELDGSTGTIHHETVKYWPALMKRQFPEWMSEAGIDAEGVEKLNDILIELYTAFNNDMLVLAAIGMRTAFDVASILLGIDEVLTFSQKIDSLTVQGKIGPRDKDRLLSLVAAGNATAHRGWKPTAEELGAMMDALEYFIHESFILPYRKARTDAKIASMDQRVPARPKKAAKKAP